MRWALLLIAAASAFAEPPVPKFRAVTLDDTIQPGCRVAVADVDGDEAPDVLLAGRRQLVWYKNPGGEAVADPARWTKYLIFKYSAEQSNVCIAARLAADRKCEIALGFGPNPKQHEAEGSMLYMVPPQDRAKEWEAVSIPGVIAAPYRMQWLGLAEPDAGSLGLIVASRTSGDDHSDSDPLSSVLCYRKPENPRQEWPAEIVGDSLHLANCFATDMFARGRTTPSSSMVIVGCREGLLKIMRRGRLWSSLADKLPASDRLMGVGEVALGIIRDPPTAIFYYATIEPAIGNRLCVHKPLPPMNVDYAPQVLSEKLIRGTSLACADMIDGSDSEIVVGWQGSPGGATETAKGGISVWTPLDKQGRTWRETVVDDRGIACEALTIEDLSRDNKIDILACGGETRNLKIYINETETPPIPTISIGPPPTGQLPPGRKIIRMPGSPPPSPRSR